MVEYELGGFGVWLVDCLHGCWGRHVEICVSEVDEMLRVIYENNMLFLRW